MKNSYRIVLILLSTSALAAFALAGAGVHAAKARVPAGPEPMTVVAGRPFEPVPASGPSKVFVVLCPEETEPATFTVRCGRTLKNVRVAAVGDFVGPGRIDRVNVEVSKVEGENLVNAVSESSGAVFAQADIGAEPTQFWVNVTVPRRTPPGLYKGVIGFYYQNKRSGVVPMQVKVLPLRLLGSSKQYVVYTSYGPTGLGNTNLEGEAYSSFLSAFGKLGFGAVSVNCRRSNYGSAIGAYGSSGLSGPLPVLMYAFGETRKSHSANPVVVEPEEPKTMIASWSATRALACPTIDEVRSVQALSKSNGLNSTLFFCADDPNSEAAIEMAKEQAKVFRRARVRAVARISDEAALQQLEDTLDGIDYHVSMPYVQSLIDGRSKRDSKKWEWYWWDARRSSVDNRLYAGVALWKSGLDGCMPAWMPKEGCGPKAGINSMLGEALREGIDDTRYITTYMKALRELKDLKREKDKDYIAATQAYLASFMSLPIDRITPSKLSEVRAKMAEYSMKLAARM